MAARLIAPRIHARTHSDFRGGILLLVIYGRRAESGKLWRERTRGLSAMWIRTFDGL